MQNDGSKAPLLYRISSLSEREQGVMSCSGRCITYLPEGCVTDEACHIEDMFVRFYENAVLMNNGRRLRASFGHFILQLDTKAPSNSIVDFESFYYISLITFHTVNSLLLRRLRLPFGNKSLQASSRLIQT